MEQYIPKSALVAEINKLKGKISDNSSYCNGWQHALRMLELSLDTLEVKEVELEKEIMRYRMNNPIIGHREESLYDYTANIAKHFFELGLRVNNPITAADRGMAEEIIINLKRVEKDYCIDLTREIEWLRNKAQKGE